jgi:hypothetical protein
MEHIHAIMFRILFEKQASCSLYAIAYKIITGVLEL